MQRFDFGISGIMLTLAQVGLSEPNASSEPQWHLFNDFLVRHITKFEALRFDPTWKLPSILAYQVKSFGNRIDTSWKDKLDTSILYRKWCTGLVVHCLSFATFVHFRID